MSKMGVGEAHMAQRYWDLGFRKNLPYVPCFIARLAVMAPGFLSAAMKSFHVSFMLTKDIF